MIYNMARHAMVFVNEELMLIKLCLCVFEGTMEQYYCYIYTNIYIFR